MAAALCSAAACNGGAPDKPPSATTARTGSAAPHEAAPHEAAPPEAAPPAAARPAPVAHSPAIPPDAAAASAGPAAADPVTHVAAKPALTAASPDEAFRAAVDAFYDHPKSQCGARCGSRVIAHQDLGNGLQVQLRVAKAAFDVPFDNYAVVFADGAGHWWAPRIADETYSDCGAGRCASGRARSMKVRRSKDLLWITVQFGGRFAEDGHPMPRTDITHFQGVFGCKLGPRPRCGALMAGSPLYNATTTIHGTRIDIGSSDDPSIVGQSAIDF